MTLAIRLKTWIYRITETIQLEKMVTMLPWVASCCRSFSPDLKFLHAVYKDSHAGTVFLGKEYIKVEGDDVLFSTSMMNRLNAAGINYS